MGYLPDRKPLKAFLDITPTIIMGNGERRELGTVRYEVEADWDELAPNTQTWMTPPTPLDYRGWIKVEFTYRLTDASKPQPQIIDAVSAYPKLQANASYGPPHAEMAYPTDAQGHPTDESGQRLRIPTHPNMIYRG